MAITIDWNTGIITVPKADTVLLQSTPIEIRELNLNTFRLALKNLEDDDQGMVYLDTHRHNTSVSVGGVTLAPVVEIINGYTITFEDGNYAVNLVGANSNVADKVNLNSVSIRASNSAGLVQTREIEQAAFNNYVCVDVVNGFGGTVYPIGTRQRPAGSLDDALLIAITRGLSEIRTLSPLTIENTHNLDNMTVSSDNWTAVTVNSGASVVNTVFVKAGLYGELGAFWNVLVDCWSYDVTNFCGWVRGGSIIDMELAPYTVENTGQSYFDDMVPFFPGQSSNITMNTDTRVAITGCRDIVTLHGLTAGAIVAVGLDEGFLNIADTCVGGIIDVSGVGEISSNLGTSTINSDALVNPRAIWYKNLLSGDPAGSASKILQMASANTTIIKDDVITINDAIETIDLLVHLLVKYQKNRTKVDAFTKTLTIYDDDNITPITVFNLKDLSGTASVTEVAEREPI